MMTKVSWYLHPFYPILALLIAVAIARAWPNGESATPRWRNVAVIGIVVLACGVAEGRLVWNSVRNRNMRGSVQGLLQGERSALAGRTVFRDKWNHADRFVLVAMVGARMGLARDVEEFLHDGQEGDYLI